MRYPKTEEGFKQFLQGLHEEFGLDINDPNLNETPHRVAKAYAEIFSGLKDTKQQLKQILSTGFPCEYNGMVLEKDIRVYSICPHHFFEITYSVDLAYIPSKNGEVLGLSKLPRIVSVLAKRPVLQEQLTKDITATLMEIKGAEGAACVVRGKHSCMGIRGANQPTTITITSSIRGIFETDVAARSEFLSLTRETV